MNGACGRKLARKCLTPSLVNNFRFNKMGWGAKTASFIVSVLFQVMGQVQVLEIGGPNWVRELPTCATSSARSLSALCSRPFAMYPRSLKCPKNPDKVFKAIFA